MSRSAFLPARPRAVRMLLALACAAMLLPPAPVRAADAPRPAASQPRAAASGVRTLEWDDLMPPGWDPMKGLDLRDLGGLSDADPRARALLDKLRAAWDNAPARPELDGARVRLAGYVVPLGGEGQALREFLLVPYFGACIHTPPPPSNQVVHVVLAQPARGVRMMDTVWVTGRLQVTTFASEMGVAGYRIEGAGTAPYRR